MLNWLRRFFSRLLYLRLFLNFSHFICILTIFLRIFIIGNRLSFVLLLPFFFLLFFDNFIYIIPRSSFFLSGTPLRFSVDGVILCWLFVPTGSQQSQEDHYGSTLKYYTPSEATLIFVFVFALPIFMQSSTDRMQPFWDKKLNCELPQ